MREEERGRERKRERERERERARESERPMETLGPRVGKDGNETGGAFSLSTCFFF